MVLTNKHTKTPLFINGKALNYLSMSAEVPSSAMKYGEIAPTKIEVEATVEAWAEVGDISTLSAAEPVDITYGDASLKAIVYSYSTNMGSSKHYTANVQFHAYQDMFAGKKKKPNPTATVKGIMPNLTPFAYFAQVLDAEGYAALEKLCLKKGVTFIWKDGTFTLLVIDKAAGHSVTKVEVLPLGYLHVCGLTDHMDYPVPSGGSHDAALNAINLEAMVEMIEAYEPVKADLSALENKSVNVFTKKPVVVKDVLAEGPIQGAMLETLNIDGKSLGELMGEDIVSPATYDPSAVKAMGDILADAITKQADPEFSLPSFSFEAAGELLPPLPGPGLTLHYNKPNPLDVPKAVDSIHDTLTSVGLISGETALKALAQHYQTGAAISGPARHTLQKLQVSILYSMFKSMGLKHGYPDFVWLRANVYRMANAEQSFGVRFVLRLKDQDLHLGAPHPDASARLLIAAMLEKALHSNKGQVFYYTHGATQEEFTSSVLQAITLKLAGSAMEGTMPVKFTKEAVKAAVDAAEAVKTEISPKGKTIKKTAEAVKANAAAQAAMEKSVGAEQSDKPVTVAKVTHEVVPLKNANALGQKVHGTSAGSVYIMAAANDKDGVKLAAKYGGNELSLRLEGDLDKIIGRIKQCGLFVVKGNGEYASVHVSVGNPLQAEMLYAAARAAILANRHIDLAGVKH